MAKKYWVPDFKKMYPEASDKVIEVLRKSERKMIYQEHDLKIDRKVRTKDGRIEYISSREDSYERLADQNIQFSGVDEGPEEQFLRELQMTQLQSALDSLSANERDLIELLFYQQKTEREVADLYHLSQNAINKRRNKILKKLRVFLENL